MDQNTEKSSLPSLESLAKSADGDISLPKVRFRGCHSHAIDSKGRVSVPAGFRSALEAAKTQDLVITNYICDGAKCLEAYPEEIWNELERRILKLSRFDSRLKSLENYYFSRAATCPLDSSGRINIPGNLRQYAGLEQEVSFTAGLRGFRIWEKRIWDHVFRQAETKLLENPDMFQGLDTEVVSEFS